MRSVYPILAILATSFLSISPARCGGGSGTGASPDGRAAPSAGDGRGQDAAAPGTPSEPLVVFLGDSLTAGLGLAEEQAFPALLDRRLRTEGVPIRVVNAGVSGDTTTGGLARLPWLLKQRPDVLVVGLGANDALRGQTLEILEGNLRTIVERGRAVGARVLLLGMRVPTNYGSDYAEGLAAIYPRVANSLGTGLVPFLLDGVGGHPALNQPDGLHPTAEGQKILAGNVYPHLRKALEAARR
jgi:acyl-CoA thioesterase-1